MVEDTYGAQSIKLPAGHMILYPATSLHHVRPVAKGARVASFFWVQSMVRDDGRRTILFDLDVAIQRLNCRSPRSSVGGSTHRRLSQPAAAVGGGLDDSQSLLLAAPGCRFAGRHRHSHHVDYRRPARLAAPDHSLRRSSSSGNLPLFHRLPGRRRRSCSANVVEARHALPTTLTLRADPAEPVSAEFGRNAVVYLHPATGQSPRRRLDGGSRLLPRNRKLASMARRRAGIAGLGARRHRRLQPALSRPPAERPLSVAAADLEPPVPAAPPPGSGAD